MTAFLFTVSRSSSLCALVLALLALTPSHLRDPGFAFPPQRNGEITATLALQVAEQGPSPGRGRVRLTLDVTGPAPLEVEAPRLEDALAGWRVEWAASSWAENEGMAVWEQTIGLVQVKPGVVPLPGVVLRFRTGPGATWEEAAWPDLLLESRGSIGPEKLPPLQPSPWPSRLALAAGMLALAFTLALIGRAGQRWRNRKRQPLPLHERALARLQETPTDLAAGVTHLDAVLRDYLEERFGVETWRKTQQEMLEAMAVKAELSSEQRTALAKLLSGCELLKFASVEDAEGLRSACEQACAFIRATAPAGQAGRVGEGAISGESRGDAQEG